MNTFRNVCYNIPSIKNVYLLTHIYIYTDYK